MLANNYSDKKLDKNRTTCCLISEFIINLKYNKI